MDSSRITEVQRNMHGTATFELESPEVGDTFVVRVSLPASYHMAPDRRYPILVALDGDAAFGAAKTTMDYINLGANFGMGKNVPDMIVVGVGYERGAIPWLLTRVRDFTPSADPSFNYNNPNFKVPASGGAAGFHAFLVERLLPELRSRYRIDDTLSILSGHSMGGLFALYAMLRPNPAFTKYLMISPFVGWDDRRIFSMESERAAAGKDLRAEAFVSYCLEPTPSYADEIKDIVAALRSRDYDGFSCTLRHYPEENHFSVVAKAFADGLYALFEG